MLIFASVVVVWASPILPFGRDLALEEPLAEEINHSALANQESHPQLSQFAKAPVPPSPVNAEQKRKNLDVVPSQLVGDVRGGRTTGPHPFADLPPEPPLVLDLTRPLLSAGAMLVPAVILLFLVSRLSTGYRGDKTSYARAVERNNAALALSQRGELMDAIEAFSSALALDPKLHAAHYNRGHCYLRLGRLEEALADIESSLRLNPNFVEAIALRGQIATLRGKYDLAAEDLNKALEMSPKNSVALTYRGNLRLAQADYENARIDFDRAIQINLAESMAYQGRGLVSLAQGKLDAALADCSQALASGSNDPTAYSLRGRVWLAKGDHDRAISDFTTAIAHSPKSADLFRDRGLAYYLNGDIEHALVDLNEAIELSPQDPLSYNNRGAAFSKAGNYSHAVADLEAAIALKSDFANPHKHLAWIKATCPQGEFRDGPRAVVEATRAIELAKQPPADWFAVLAAAYAEAGDFEQAVSYQERCVDASAPKDKAAAQERLVLFQARQPFREPAAVPAVLRH
jgi:tetratricopeptide (TPR) repeat protein